MNAVSGKALPGSTKRYDALRLAKLAYDELLVSAPAVPMAIPVSPNNNAASSTIDHTDLFATPSAPSVDSVSAAIAPPFKTTYPPLPPPSPVSTGGEHQPLDRAGKKGAHFK